jgi:hypothetical protein
MVRVYVMLMKVARNSLFAGTQCRKMKPQLPPEIAALLPLEIVKHIYKFVPHLKPKKDRSPGSLTLSPAAERDLRLIQYSTLKGKNEMYLWDLDDFILR